MTSKTPKAPEITYWEYIRLDKLLTIQGGVEGQGDVELADEMLFIVIHQSIELMFKLLLTELKSARDQLNARYVPEDALPEVVKHLGRANEALRAAVGHFRYMELLTPLDFLEFRAKLGTSSGAQSFQMRQIELMLGLTLEERQRTLDRLRARLERPSDADAFKNFILDPVNAILKQIQAQIALREGQGQDTAIDRWAASAIEASLADMDQHGTLRSALERWLYRTPICDSAPPAPDGPEAPSDFKADQLIVRNFTDDYLERGRALGWDQDQLTAVRRFLRGDEAAPMDWTTERTRAALLFIEMYLDLPLLAWPRMLLEKVVELEKLMVEFRNVHARMVERVIGSRPGTGGSPGLEYLDLTRDMRIFPELIQIRGILIPRDRRWHFPDMEDFGFRRER